MGVGTGEYSFLVNIGMGSSSYAGVKELWRIFNRGNLWESFPLSCTDVKVVDLNGRIGQGIQDFIDMPSPNISPAILFGENLQKVFYSRKPIIIQDQPEFIRSVSEDIGNDLGKLLWSSLLSHVSFPKGGCYLPCVA